MSHKHYIYAGNRPIAIYTQRSTGVNDTRYLHADNLGSITVITNETGAVVERLSYDPFGKRRNLDGSDATTALTSAQLRHGYTEHEHLDEVGELLATGDAGACAIDVEYRDIGGIGAIGRACIDDSHHSHTYALGGSVAPEDLAAPARMRSLGPQYCSSKNVLTNCLCRRC